MGFSISGIKSAVDMRPGPMGALRPGLLCVAHVRKNLMPERHTRTSDIL